MADCNHNCENCSVEGCGERVDFKAHLNELSHIKKIYAVVSGKGGVGKSMVTSSLASELAKKGLKVGILDADITGPSIPKMFGLHEKCSALNEKLILPVLTNLEIKVISINNLVDDEETPIIWRGPVIAGAVKQFYEDVVWDELDVLLIDLPPGTGDVPLTIYQSIPLDGIIVVTTPQDLVSMIVMKAVNMAKEMSIPLLAIVENMSYAICPHCHEKIEIFPSSLKQIKDEVNAKISVKLPIDSHIAKACDEGKIELVNNEPLIALADLIKEELD